MNSMNVEDALKRPEFAWLNGIISSIDDIFARSKKTNIFTKEKTPGEKRKANAEKITPLFESIEKYMKAHEPWKSMNEPNFISNLNAINNYVYAKVWKDWQDDELREKDRKAYEHIQILSSFETAQSFDLPAGTFDNPLCAQAIDDIKTLNKPNSPMKKLDAIYEACNKFYIIAKSLDHVVTADSLIAFLTYVTLHSRLKNIATNIEFIEPGCSLVITHVSDTTPPPRLAEKISTSEFNGIITPIRELTEASDFEIRGTGAFKGAAIGASAMTPLAAFVGIATLGVGVPFSIIIMGAGAMLGTGFGAALPLELRETINKIDSYVEFTNNCLLRPRGVVLISPVTTNLSRVLGLAKISSEKLRTLTWIINSVPKELDNQLSDKDE